MTNLGIWDYGWKPLWRNTKCLNVCLEKYSIFVCFCFFWYFFWCYILSYIFSSLLFIAGLLPGKWTSCAGAPASYIRRWQTPEIGYKYIMWLTLTPSLCDFVNFPWVIKCYRVPRSNFLKLSYTYVVVTSLTWSNDDK